MDNFDLHSEVLDCLYEGVYCVDRDRKIIYWNKSAERISGFNAEETIGKYCYDNMLNHVDTNNNKLCANGCPLQQAIEDGEQHEAGVYLHHKLGHRVGVAVKTIPLISNDEIIGAIEVFIDDKEKFNNNKTLNELRLLAMHDKLTGLPNRRYIDSFFSNRFREFKELELPFAIISMDIDNFKIFNDTYGHDVGDQVLKMVSRTFKSTIRKSDLVGRWGGEEFMAILLSISQDKLPIVAENMRMLIETSVLRLNEDQLNVTISIGATLAKDGDTHSSIKKRADTALYMSKENGRNRVTIL